VALTCRPVRRRLARLGIAQSAIAWRNTRS
jgi:hypothetical protein